MTRDSPIEQTGRAHLVVTSCEVCKQSFTVPESTAEAGMTCEDCRAAVRELADIENAIRKSAGENVNVRIDRRAARIGFDTWEMNMSYRSSLVGSVCAAVGESERWQVSRVHDPVDHDGDMTGSLVTIRRTDR